MKHVIAPLMIRTGPETPDLHERSDANLRARRRADRQFFEDHSGSGVRTVYRLICALSGWRA